MPEPLLDLKVHIEAIVRLHDERVVARELLLRPVGGGDLRGRAADAAVDMAWVTAYALHTASILLEHDQTPLHVNITPEDLCRPEFTGQVRAALQPSDPSSLVLEITEQTELRPGPQLADTLIELRRMGIRFAIDDFGDGWAGVESIEAVRPEIIKVRLGRLLEGPHPGAMAHAIVELAARHHAQVVVEQVETAADLGLVRAFGFGHAQGWHWGPGHEPGLLAR